MKQHRAAPCLVLLFGMLTLHSLVLPSAFAQELRTFLVDFGQPGFEVEVNGQAYVTDEQGLLRVSLEVADGEALRFRSLDPSWVLNLSRQVPVEDPSVPVLWDFRSKLRPTAFRPTEFRPTVPPPSAPPSDPSPPDPSPAKPSARSDPCRNRKSLRCRQARWMEFEQARGRGDCAAAVGVLAELEANYPELLTAESGVVTFARTFLDCGIRDHDSTLIRRSVDLALAFDDGGLWCRDIESRLLARGFEALGDLRSAADSARARRPHCGAESTAALEWEIYFRFRLGETEAYDALAQEAPRKLRLFFQAWLESSRGECVTEVELEPLGDLPCRGLPQDFCSRQYGRILLTCGDGPDDFISAARYLRAALPPDPETWGSLTGGRQLILELAEAEVLSGDVTSAVSLYERLLRLSEAGAVFESDRVAFAVITNNLCVLRGRLDRAMTSGEIVRDLEALEAALSLMPDERRLRLRLQHNALALRIRLLEKATDLDAQQQLARLQELSAPFAEYQKELASLAATAPSRLLGGSDLLLEMFDQEGRRFAIAVP